MGLHTWLGTFFEVCTWQYQRIGTVIVWRLMTFPILFGWVNRCEKVPLISVVPANKVHDWPLTFKEANYTCATQPNILHCVSPFLLLCLIFYPVFSCFFLFVCFLYTIITMCFCWIISFCLVKQKKRGVRLFCLNRGARVEKDFSTNIHTDKLVQSITLHSG